MGPIGQGCIGCLGLGGQRVHIGIAGDRMADAELPVLGGPTGNQDLTNTTLNRYGVVL